MKKTMYKFLLATLLCLTLILSVTACSPKSENGNVDVTQKQETTGTQKAPETTPAKEPVQLTFSTFNAWWTSGTIQKAIEMYQNETGNKIDPQIFPDDQFVNVINTKMASGETPDVFAIWPTGATSRFRKDLLEPLDGPWVSKLNIDRAKVAGYADSDGKVYSAPYGGASIQGIMYNKELFKTAGITPPFKTYDEFMAACEALKKLGVTPLTLPNKEGWTTQIVFYAGSAYIAAKDSEFAVSIASNKIKPSESPAIVSLMERLLAIRDKGYTNEDHLSTTMAMAEQALAEGKTAMVFGGDWLWTDFGSSLIIRI